MARALIVDDDAAFVSGLAEMVKREGFTVTTAGTLRDARRELADAPPDILLVDLFLPDGTGMDMLEGLEPPAGPEVVLITGNASVETAVDALRRGATDYLTKPLDMGAAEGHARRSRAHDRAEGPDRLAARRAAPARAASARWSAARRRCRRSTT